MERGDDPAEIVERLGLEKIDDADALEAHVDAVLDEWPGKVTEYREGKAGLLGFFVGRVMQATDGRADPKLVKEMLSVPPRGDGAPSLEARGGPVHLPQIRPMSRDL